MSFLQKLQQCWFLCRLFLCGGCFVVVPFPCFTKVVIARYCGRLNLSGSCANRFKTELSASLTSMLSASRQIAKRRLGSLLASVKATMSTQFPAETAQVSISNLHSMFCSDKTGTPTQNITTIEPEFHGVRLQNRVLSFALLAKCTLLSTATRLIYSLLDPAVKATESIVATYCHNHENIKADVVPKGLCFFILRWGCREHFVSGCWHSSGRDRGRYPRECWLSTLGVLHPGVPVMWYGHIRDMSPSAVRL